MPRSRSKPKPKSAPAKRSRWDWRRVAGGIGELFRNLSLIAFGTPFIEPFLSGGPIDPLRAGGGFVAGLVFLTIALIFDHERRD